MCGGWRRVDIRDESSHVTDAAHQAADHSPAQFAPMYARRLVDDGSHTFRAHNAPYEERDARRGCDDCREGEEMADLVNGEPDRRQGDEPEEEEAHEITRRYPRRGR